MATVQSNASAAPAQARPRRPDLRGYEQLGLDVELVDYSSHPMLADDSG